MAGLVPTIRALSRYQLVAVLCRFGVLHDLGQKDGAEKNFPPEGKARHEGQHPGLNGPKNDSDAPMLPRIRRLIGADSTRQSTLVIVAKCKSGFEARRHPVEEDTEFQWDRLAWRVDNVDWQGLLLEVLQHQL